MGLRVVSGNRKGQRLSTLKGQAIRPTADRIKESLFNIHSQHIKDTNVLDLFAGTGSLGIEALSRGAASAVFIDHSNKALHTMGKLVPVLVILVLAACGSKNEELCSTGSEFYQQGDWAKAVQAFDEYIQSNSDFEKSWLNWNPAFERALTAKGNAHFELGQYEQAIAHFDTALQIREAVFPRNHPDIVRGYNNIGNVYLLTGNKDKALELLLHSLALQPEPPIDPYPATIRALGRIYEDLNDAYRARKYLGLALDAYRQFYPNAPWEIASAYTDLAHFHLNEEAYDVSGSCARTGLSASQAAYCSAWRMSSRSRCG